MTSNDERLEDADEGLELAWGLIANAYGGDWDLAPQDWKDAAERWRDKYWHGPIMRGLNIDEVLAEIWDIMHSNSRELEVRQGLAYLVCNKYMEGLKKGEQTDA